MKGMEAWALLSPLLARVTQLDNDTLNEAWVTLFCACKKYDEVQNEHRKSESDIRPD